MASLSLTQFLTLDGVYQAPGGPQEDPSGGFDKGGWVAPYVDEDFGGFVDEVFARPAAFLLGRRTYEIFASYWPHQTDSDDRVASTLNSLPKYVVSTTLTSGDWPTTTVLRGDAADAVAALKQRVDGEIQMHGSGGLAQTLLAHGLIDRLHLLVFPVVLGAGRRLFPEGATPSAFRLLDARTTAAGVSIHTYELAGPPRFGTVGE
ncbi:dihydrofolate reductase family protein [Streptomyces sp. NPDC126499]|uniref:dihydrofolate reductase family protein n=1 Tax=Streptomyces sp. NPDC126499 TaxID=3155314 RepID=UPI00332A6BC5